MKLKIISATIGLGATLKKEKIKKKYRVKKNKKWKFVAEGACQINLRVATDPAIRLRERFTSSIGDYVCVETRSDCCEFKSLSMITIQGNANFTVGEVMDFASIGFMTGEANSGMPTIYDKTN